jgi:ABC-type nitrate/sulfonate/bicarbonate transport system permease component
MMRALGRYLPVLLLLGLWEAVSRLGLVSTQMLPPFSSVVTAFVGLVGDGDLLINAIASLRRAALGFVLAILVGTMLGAGMALSPRFRLVVNPLVQIFYPLPKSALIPLVLIWFGMGDPSKTFLVFLGCLLPMILGTYNGMIGIDQSLVWSARSLGARPAAIVAGIMLPAALPQILTGLRTAVAFAFLLMVTSELVIARDGLGYLIGRLGDSGVYPAMFAVILTVTMLGFIADRGFMMLTNILLRWRE